ncbi:MAG: type IV toxin-antitoxin system AbiEi family antitoxin domain-containing protein [Lutisporaceae bacterium]
MNIDRIKLEFKKNGGILKTSELSGVGISSRQIKKLLDEGVIKKIKYGYYELSEHIPSEEVVIARLFPNAVIFLESALVHYGYTDRIPSAWQIAVNKNSEKSQYKTEFYSIEPYYLEPKFIGVGIDRFKLDGITINIYDRDRTICDVLRYEKKIEKEVFSNALTRYLKDQEKNIRKLYEYAEVFNIKNKVQTYIGVWL